MKSKFFLVAVFALIFVYFLPVFGWGEEVKPDLTTPPPPPVPVCKTGLGLAGIVLEDGTRNPLPSKSYPYTHISLWKYADNPDDGNTDKVLVFVNGTNQWQDCPQGVVDESGSFLFSVDYAGNPLSTTEEHILMMQAEDGFLTSYRQKIWIRSDKKVTDLGVIFLKKSDITISNIRAEFVSVINGSMLIVSYLLTNRGQGEKTLRPYLAMHVPGDMNYVLVHNETVATVSGRCSQWVNHVVFLRRLIPGFSVFGEITVPESGDVLSTQARGSFLTHTK